jgi:hypothetical protein
VVPAGLVEGPNAGRVRSGAKAAKVATEVLGAAEAVAPEVLRLAC